MRLPLEPALPADYRAMFSWRKEALGVRHNPYASIEFADFVRSAEKVGTDFSDLKKFDVFQFIVRIQGEPAGSITLKGLSHMMGYAELGYQVAEKFQGQGVGTGMIRALIEKVFAETEIRRLYAFVHDENIASCRVLEKLGFQREGLLREHYILQGKPANEVFFGLLRADWRG